jgi:hypothetical protein
MLGLLLNIGAAEEVGFKNRIRAGIDRRIKYERLLNNGFRIGTDFGYKLVVAGDRALHMDQQPDFWLWTLGHEFAIRGITVENKVSGFGWFGNRRAIKYDAILIKKFALRPELELSPSLDCVRYIFNPDNSGYYDRVDVHDLQIKAEIGLNLDWKF